MTISRGFMFAFFMVFPLNAKRNFHAVCIYADFYKTRITRKYVQREKFYVHSIPI